MRGNVLFPFLRLAGFIQHYHLQRQPFSTNDILSSIQLKKPLCTKSTSSSSIPLVLDSQLVVRSATINTDVQASLCCGDFRPRVNTQQCARADLFSFVKKVHVDLHSGWTGLHSHYSCIREPHCPHQPCPVFGVVCFVDDYHPAGVRQNPNVVWISLVTSDVEHFPMCIGHLYFITENFLLISLIHLLTGLLEFWMLNFLSLLYALAFSKSSNISKTFSHFLLNCFFFQTAAPSFS